MIVTLLPLLALSLPHFFGPSSVEIVRRREIGGWVVTASSNRFTKRVNCMLRSGDMEVERSAVVFRFPRRVDTTDAWFRVGSDEARPWRTLAAELVESGVRIRFQDIKNPSQGRVPIPISLVRYADIVAISPTPHAVPKMFRIRGLSAALAEAAALGCESRDLEGTDHQ